MSLGLGAGRRLVPIRCQPDIEVECFDHDLSWETPHHMHFKERPWPRWPNAGRELLERHPSSNYRRVISRQV
jgi:hypothetical protein